MDRLALSWTKKAIIASLSSALVSLGVYIVVLITKKHETSALHASGPGVSERLLLVTVLNRHGDRAAVGDLANIDRHAEKPNFFWPNGMSNLTDMGERRMFKLGVALRREYHDFLDYTTDSVMALTSNSFRCKQSQQATLRGLYSIHSTLDNGIELAKKLESANLTGVRVGAGTSSIWQEIAQDTQLLPSLDESYYSHSTYAKNHVSPLNRDIRNDADINSLPGVDKLCDVLKERYQLPCDSTIDLWTQIECELYLDRTNETISYMDHFASWINQKVAEDSSTGQSVTMYELFEQVMFLAYLRRIDHNGHYLITAPIVNALIESSSVALGMNPASNRARQFVGKKLILGSSHDIILTILLHDMGVIPIDGKSWAKNLMKAKHEGLSDVERYRLGLKMAHFGVSVRFELVHVESPSGNWPMVRLGIYSEPDPNAPTVEWTPVQLGLVCQRRFLEMNPGKEPLLYYPPSYSKVYVNRKYDCPFELFQEVMKPWKYDEQKHENIFQDSN